MCGIAGWFSRSPIEEQATVSRLTAMLEAIAHRGPDGTGQWHQAGVALGHVRLAIIDIADGQQPMVSRDGQVVLSYNGEIYNYREIRDELSRHGVQFHTHSDTEVILQLYRKEGINGFSRLRGMYAFAIWDREKNTGLLVRDPLGIKPLFYQQTKDGELIFGSEAKAILASGHAAALDESALHLLMNFRYLPGEYTLFRGIQQLAPGQVICWRDGDISQHRLAVAETGQEDPMLALEESVRAHLTADVEVGAYLSGGIDSATVVALAQRHLSEPLRTFTLKVGDDPAEADNAAESARLLGVRNAQYDVYENGIEARLRRLIHHLETPKINALQVSQLAEVTSGNVKVALSGLGGDELFYGYNAHRIMAQAASAARMIPPFVAAPLGNVGSNLLQRLISTPWNEPQRAAEMLAAIDDWPKVYGLLRNLWDSPQLRTRVYGPRMLDQPLPDAFEEIRRRWPTDLDPVSATVEFEWRNKMVNDLLWNEDRVSMAEGLEVRVPMVDLRVKQSLWQFNRGTLMPGGKPKGYLKDRLSTILPAHILNRPKSGFQVDAGAFFHQHLLPLSREWLSEEKVRRAGLFNPDFVKQLQSLSPTKAHRWHYFQLYLILGAHLWLDIFTPSNA